LGKSTARALQVAVSENFEMPTAGHYLRWFARRVVASILLPPVLLFDLCMIVGESLFGTFNPMIVHVFAVCLWLVAAVLAVRALCGPAAAASALEITGPPDISITEQHIVLHMSVHSALKCFGQSCVLLICSLGVLITTCTQILLSLPPLLVACTFLVATIMVHIS